MLPARQREAVLPERRGALAQPGSRSAQWLPVAAVAAIAWTAHFALAHRFGLYEDDYAFVSPTLAWTWADAWRHVRWCFTSFPQGRPIGFLLGSILPFLCFRLGGLHLVYACASLFVVANAVLAYRLLDGRFGPAAALPGALAFTLFPADTTHPLLTHALILQPALTFVLLALLAYVSQRRAASFALAAAALLTYESAVLPFLSAPLLSPGWDRRLLRRWIWHGLGVGALVAAAVALRSAVGESRVAELGAAAGELPARIANSLWIGPLTSLRAFIHAPGLAADRLDLATGAAAAGGIVAACVAALVWRGQRAEPDDASLRRAALAGVAMWVTSYGFAFTHYPPVGVEGRRTSVHLAAALGAALVSGAIASFAGKVVRGRTPLRAGVSALVGATAALLWLFHLGVQEGFVAAAVRQRSYWGRILSQAPDVAPGSLVMVVGIQPEATPYILTSSWADTLVPRQLLRAPRGEPQVSLVNAAHFDLFASLAVRNGRLWWNEKLPSWVAVDRTRPIDLDRLVVVRQTRDGWRRSYEPLEVNGTKWQIGSGGVARPGSLEKGPLFELLLGDVHLPPFIAVR